MTHRFARGEVDLCHADIVRTPSSTGVLLCATSRRIGLDINRDSRSTRSVPVRGAAKVRVGVRVRVRVRIRVRIRVRLGLGPGLGPGLGLGRLKEQACMDR